jgi:hypothetical protein
MAEKRTVSARDTYVLDDEALQELDDVSLTGVMRDVTESIKKLEFEQQREAEGMDADGSDSGEFDLGFLTADD